MTSLAHWMETALAGGSMLALPLAFLGGAITGLNPCCLPFYPAAAATCCATYERERRIVMSRALAFVGGVAFATALLGVVAVLVGRVMTAIGGAAAYAIAAVPIVMGLVLFGVIPLPQPRMPARAATMRAAGVFLLGFIFALVLAPCGTPVLASILSYAALSRSIAFGATLLFLYGVGFALPAVSLGTAAAALVERFEHALPAQMMKRATGVGLIVFGLYLVARV
ncbi:MAG TPA: cytochrome c biogenesis CcdA family protein [Thermoanaerobaculia bacterium]|nr:cytochrome c biogenesis CcdA family protein [Thermoanaerobaculia bacterium]